MSYSNEIFCSIGYTQLFPFTFLLLFGTRFFSMLDLSLLSLSIFLSLHFFAGTCFDSRILSIIICIISFCITLRCIRQSLRISLCLLYVLLYLALFILSSFSLHSLFILSSFSLHSLFILSSFSLASPSLLILFSLSFSSLYFSTDAITLSKSSTNFSLISSQTPCSTNNCFSAVQSIFVCMRVTSERPNSISSVAISKIDNKQSATKVEIDQLLLNMQKLFEPFYITFVKYQ